jgi:protein TonB
VKLPAFFLTEHAAARAGHLSLRCTPSLLTVRFVDPEGFNRVFQDTPLEVILVNAKSRPSRTPTKAKAIAQHTLAGGGDADKGRATSRCRPRH